MLIVYIFILNHPQNHGTNNREPKKCVMYIFKAYTVIVKVLSKYVSVMCVSGCIFKVDTIQYFLTKGWVDFLYKEFFFLITDALVVL